jgi:hypothetical protein
MCGEGFVGKRDFLRDVYDTYLPPPAVLLLDAGTADD